MPFSDYQNTITFIINNIEEMIRDIEIFRDENNLRLSDSKMKLSQEQISNIKRLFLIGFSDADQAEQARDDFENDIGPVHLDDLEDYESSRDRLEEANQIDPESLQDLIEIYNILSGDNYQTDYTDDDDFVQPDDFSNHELDGIDHLFSNIIEETINYKEKSHKNIVNSDDSESDIPF